MKIEQELIDESYRGFVRRDLVDLYQRFIVKEVEEKYIIHHYLMR